MKYIIIKLFYVNNRYNLLIKQSRISELTKIIDHETRFECNTDEELYSYLKIFTPNDKYRRAKVYLDLITEKIFIEVMTKNNELGTKGDVQKKLEELYPNYKKEYDVELYQSTLFDNKKVYILTLIPKKLMIFKTLNIQFAKKYNYIFDLTSLRNFINKERSYFLKKKVLLIQPDTLIYRYYEIIHGNVTNHLVIETNDQSKTMMEKIIIEENEIRYDEIIIDSCFKTYIKFVDLYPSSNIVYSEHISRIRGIDERKVII